MAGWSLSHIKVFQKERSVEFMQSGDRLQRHKKKDQEKKEPERAATSTLDQDGGIDAVFGRSERAVQRTREGSTITQPSWCQQTFMNDLLTKEVHALHSTHLRLWIPVASEEFLAARMRATSSLAPRAYRDK